MGLLTSIVSGGGGGGTAPTAPESVVVGTGSYTVPALKFAIVSATTSSSGAVHSSASGFSNVSGAFSATASSNANQASVPSGAVISTSVSNPSNASSDTHTTGTSFVYINGIPLCSSYSKAAGGNNGNWWSAKVHAGHASWVAQIYPV